MVVSARLPWKNIFKLHASVLALVTAIAAAVIVVDRVLRIRVPGSAIPYQIAGVALAILLGFRNNAAYDRWWEGRKLWGGIVNASRALGRQITTFARKSPDGSDDDVRAFQREVLHRHVAWLNALRCQLRGQDPLDQLDGLVEHLGVATAVVVVALSFMFLVLSAIGRFLEDPFTTGPNALARTAICRTIEINLRQALGETDLPPAVVPQRVGTVDLLM